MARAYFKGEWHQLPESSMLMGAKVRETLRVPEDKDLYCLYVDVPDDVLIEPDARFAFSGNVHFYSVPQDDKWRGT